VATIALPERCTQALERHLRPELFKALCDPRRLALVAQLAVAPEPTNVSDAASCCGVHISGVSRHLSILRDAGVLTAIKRGREVVYRVNFREIVATLRGLADALEDCCTAAGCCAPPNQTEETDP
jgi:ArsR family transcriptional regulator, arsenate/arsenite/antimonite-responsive transcriptional repressor